MVNLNQFDSSESFDEDHNVELQKAINTYFVRHHKEIQSLKDEISLLKHENTKLREDAEKLRLFKDVEEAQKQRKIDSVKHHAIAQKEDVEAYLLRIIDDNEEAQKQQKLRTFKRKNARGTFMNTLSAREPLINPVTGRPLRSPA